MALPTLQQKSVEPLLYIRQPVRHPSPRNKMGKSNYGEHYQFVIIPTRWKIFGFADMWWLVSECLQRESC